MRTKHWATIASICISLLALLVALGGCGGDSLSSQLKPSAYTPEATGPFDILSPAEMLTQMGGNKGASALTLYRTGSEFSSSMNQRCTAQGTEALFTPAYAGTWSGFDTVAYGVYRMYLSGYTGSSVVNLHWSTPPADLGNVYIGFSQWTKDRWVWYHGPDDGSLEIPAPGYIQYIKPGLTGDILIAVFVLGSDNAQLNEMWFGDVYPIHKISGHVTATSGQGIPGVNIAFSGGLASVTTDNSGYFEANRVYNGNYTVTPAKAGLSFTPTYLPALVNDCDASGLNFSTQSAQGDWWMFGHDRVHTRRSGLNGPQDNTLKWQYNTGAAVNSTAAVARDGTLYFGGADQKMHALNPDGTQKWAYSVGDAIWSSPAVGVDGTVYFGSLDNNIYAIGPTGAFAWNFATGDDVYSSPCIGQDGTIYVGSYDDKLYALEVDGSEKWSYSSGGDIASSPAVGPTGAIYFGCGDNKLYALNADGTLGWTYETGDAITMSSPSVGIDGTIYIGSLDGTLYAVNPDGTLNWDYATGDKIWGSPAIGTDNTVYVGSWDGSLYALNPGGSLKWSYPTGAALYSSPLVSADGTVYVGGTDGTMYALTSAGALKWSTSSGADYISSPVIGSDGAVYIGCENGRMYAYGAGGLTYIISGYVKDPQGNGMDSVTVAFDALPATVTDSTGFWQQTNVPGGNYTATPSKTSWTFNPADYAFNVTTGNLTLPDFVGDPISASGYVKLAGGQGVDGVTLSFTGGVSSVVTDSNGFWRAGPIPDGGYTVTPAKTGYFFTPASRDFTIAGADVSVADITGDSNIASGYVKDGDGAGIANVALNFTNGLPSVTTNAGGYWSRDAIPNGSYTVTPVKNGYTFVPVNRNFTINNNDQTLGDFVGTGGAVIEITDVSTDKTTHKSDGTENAAQLNVETDPSPADTYAWTGPGDFSSTSIANPTWKPNGSTPLGKVTLTIYVEAGAANDTATIDMYVTTQAIKGSWSGHQIGEPPGSGHVPDFSLAALQYLEPLNIGGNITTFNGTFYEFTADNVVLFDRWELW